MSFVVITPDGEFLHRAEPVTAEKIRTAVGGDGFDLIRLRHKASMYAFVHDAGHMIGLPRNPVGACVIAWLGANAYPYCGPVVITGWQEPDNDSELRDLGELDLSIIAAMHSEVRQVLNGQTGVLLDQHRIDDLVGYAEFVRTAPTPTITVRGL